MNKCALSRLSSLEASCDGNAPLQAVEGISWFVEVTAVTLTRQESECRLVDGDPGNLASVVTIDAIYGETTRIEMPSIEQLIQAINNAMGDVHLHVSSFTDMSSTAHIIVRNYSVDTSFVIRAGYVSTGHVGQVVTGHYVVLRLSTYDIHINRMFQVPMMYQIFRCPSGCDIMTTTTYVVDPPQDFPANKIRMKTTTYKIADTAILHKYFIPIMFFDQLDGILDIPDSTTWAAFQYGTSMTLTGAFMRIASHDSRTNHKYAISISGMFGDYHIQPGSNTAVNLPNIIPRLPAEIILVEHQADIVCNGIEFLPSSFHFKSFSCIFEDLFSEDTLENDCPLNLILQE